MPRPHRLDFRGAIHAVHVRGRNGANIFFDAAILKSPSEIPRGAAPGVLQFERLLGGACEECGSRLIGYSVEPNSAMLIVQRLGAPLEAVMQRLSGQYSRYFHAHGPWSSAGDLTSGAHGTPAPARGDHAPPTLRVFEARYESKVLALEYLPHALRRAHSRPVLARLCKRAVDYPFGSAQAYMGERARVRLDRNLVTIALKRRGLIGRRGYQKFMEQPETTLVADVLEFGSMFDPRIAGSEMFARQVRGRLERPAPAPTREQLVAGVARLMRQEPAKIFSKTHTGALGRSLVAWYGLRSGVESLELIGKWFSVSGATLGQGIRHYRKVMPRLFNLPMPGMDLECGIGLPENTRHEL